MASVMLFLTAIIAIWGVCLVAAQEDPAACFDTGPQCSFYRNSCAAITWMPRLCPGTCDPACAGKACRELIQDCEENKALCQTAKGAALEVMELQCAVACGTCPKMVAEGKKELPTCRDDATECRTNAHLCTTMPSYARRCQATCGWCVNGCRDIALNCALRKADCALTNVKGAIARAECPVTCGACKLAPPPTANSQLMITFKTISVPADWTYYDKVPANRDPSQATTLAIAKANFATAMNKVVAGILKSVPSLSDYGTMELLPAKSCFTQVEALNFDANQLSVDHLGPVAIIVQKSIVGTCLRTSVLAPANCRKVNNFELAQAKIVLKLSYTPTAQTQIDIVSAFKTNAWNLGYFVMDDAIVGGQGLDGCVGV